MISVFAFFILYPGTPVETKRSQNQIWGVHKQQLAQSLSRNVWTNNYPTIVRLLGADDEFDALVYYNIEPQLNEYIDNLILRYKPDYSAVVALQADTGRILAMSSYEKDNFTNRNLALHSGFPAASVFKIVTAAAAIDTGAAKPNSIYAYNGKNTSLYRANVFRHKTNKWTRNTSLVRAFALSINTVFGRLGLYDVGGENLKQYADNFGFNQPIPFDISIDSSKTGFQVDDEWSIVEAASGFTTETTISPLHGAMIASVIANDGVMVEPNLIDFAVHPSGPLLYQSNLVESRVFDKQTADDMRVLMRATVRRGSARKHFRSFFKGAYTDLDVGGKTGSLTGHNPQGKTEWFVGYGDSGKDKIAIAAVVVNKDKWRVKPAYLARKILEEYFKPESQNG